MEYIVITVNETYVGDAASELKKRVNHNISIGWKPLGGVSVSIACDGKALSKVVMSQAMIKE